MPLAKGSYYRLKSTPNYSFVKVIRVLPARSQDNKLSHVVVECEHTVNIGDTFGFIRRFRLHEICPTKHAPDVVESAASVSIPPASEVSASEAESTPAHTQVM